VLALCREAEQVLALFVVRGGHAESQLERIALHAELVVAVVVLALELCPMWDVDRGHTFRKQPTSTWVAAETSMRCVPGVTSLA